MNHNLTDQTSYDSLIRQAEVLGRYFLKKHPTDKIKHLYAEIIGKSKGLSRQDQRLLLFATKHHRSLGLIDAGLALMRPDSEVRRRLYIMFALLEASPDYCDYFLPKKRGPFYLFIIVWAGLSALFKAAVGCLLVKALV